jgi:hypothetical protein
MPFVYRSAIHLEQQPKVDGGECARLVQHYNLHMGHTSTWRAGENVIDVLASGRQIEQGTAIATFVNGRDHVNQDDGPVEPASGSALS